MNCKLLNKELEKIKNKKNSSVLKKLEDLKINYFVLDSEEYGYFRVRVVIDSDLKNYKFTDIWYSRFDNGWVATDYYQYI